MTLTYNSHTVDILRSGALDWQCATVSLATGMHTDTVHQALKHLIKRYRATRGEINGIWHGDPDERDMPSTKFELEKIFEQGYRIKITHYGGQ